MESGEPRVRGSRNSEHGRLTTRLAVTTVVINLEYRILTIQELPAERCRQHLGSYLRKTSWVPVPYT